MNNTPELQHIAIEYLFEGLVLMEDIFNYDGKLLLLAKGSVITERIIQQLKRYNGSSRNILVASATYQVLKERSLPANNVLAQEYVEEKVGYTAVEKQTNAFLEDIQQTQMVSKVQADIITAEVREALQSIDPALIFQCINAPNPPDEYLRRHSTNVGFLNGLMGKWLQLPIQAVEMLVLAGLVHDVGKTKIPEEILNQPTRLTLSEFEVIKMHPLYSYELLSSDKQFIEPIKLAARHHHEKMNGSGYPDNLPGEQISLYARITAVCDIYDAMVSKRVYKEASNPFHIISQLAKMQFSELDGGLVRVFTDNMPIELVGKSVLLSDGSIGKVKFILENDLEYPLVEVNGIIKKTSQKFSCVRIIFDE